MPRIMTRILLGPLALTLLASLLPGQQSPPDLILLNGKIFTSDSAHPYEPAGFHLQFKSAEPTWAEVAEELATAVVKTPKGTLIHGEIGPVAFLDAWRTVRRCS